MYIGGFMLLTIDINFYDSPTITDMKLMHICVFLLGPLNRGGVTSFFSTRIYRSKTLDFSYLGID